MTSESTVYSASITTPSGLTFSTSVVVPPEAEYDDQHELTEVVQAGVARMIGMDARRGPVHNTWCDATLPGLVWPDQEEPSVTLRCVLPAGHYPGRPHEAPQHRVGTGLTSPGPVTWTDADRPQCRAVALTDTEEGRCVLAEHHRGVHATAAGLSFTDVPC